MNANTISKRLTKLRGSKRQDEVAKAVGISVSALSMYENGQRIPRDEIKVRIAKYYEISIENLFFNDENDTKSVKTG